MDPAPGEYAAIEADDIINDADSAFDEESVASSTASITSSILQFREENGRLYNSYKDGTYVLPSDEEERDRQDLQNHLCFITFDHKLSFAPFTKLHRVLDVGTGTGIWAINFADEHPEAQVIGVDLAPQQPIFVPPNLSFEIDDLELEWTFSKKFDYIHSMMMTGAFGNWPKFYQQSFDHLHSGGWIEVQDIYFPIRCDDDTMPSTSAIARWSTLMQEAADKLGRPLDTCARAKEMMEAAGFVDVVLIPYKWPQNRWPKEKKYKELGMWVQENFVSGVEAMSLALFTRGLGWSLDEVRVFVAMVKNDMKDQRIHAYWNLSVVYGRKP